MSRSEGFPRTGYLLPARGTPGVSPDGESCWDAAAAVSHLELQVDLRPSKKQQFQRILLDLRPNKKQQFQRILLDLRPSKKQQFQRILLDLRTSKKQQFQIILPGSIPSKKQQSQIVIPGSSPKIEQNLKLEIDDHCEIGGSGCRRSIRLVKSVCFRRV